MSLGLILSEWTKVRIGRWMYTILILSFLIAALGIFGVAAANREMLELGTISAEAATAESARYWFTMHLFTSILGAMFVTREYANGAIGRSVLLSERRSQVINSKLVVVVGFVSVLALVVAALAVVTPRFAIDAPFRPVWTGDATLSVLGVCFAMVIAAVWGLMIGFIVRSSVAAVGVLLITTLLVDEALFALSSTVGKFTFTIALGAAFRDTREDLLSPLMGYVVASAWLAVAMALTYWSFNRRDVL